ncbi:MAG TPA: HAD family hydrolase [Verrucomicrobiae bacterium]|jgi:hypothetical protein|nr:HAD family hydrolase [Verrucomicrobiae bacterium]
MRFSTLATDYDGTIAHHGTVDAATVDALQRLKESGRKVLLVTGREIPDLLNVFPEPLIFDRVVAENGAVLYYPESKRSRALAEAPPREFSELLRARGVNTLSVGQVIVATVDPYETEVRLAIKELKLGLEIILNKGSIMVLPPNVTKASGLATALEELRIAPANVVGIGDAENDHALLKICGYGVAVANALPELKKTAHWTTPSGHGQGVRELIEKLLTDSILPESGSSLAASREGATV